MFVSLVLSLSLGANPTFSSLVGEVTVGPVAPGVIQLPYITWGGDVATFHANGGLETAPESIFNKLDLKFKMTAGDDFVQQVRDYLSGKSPYLRGTFLMLAQASEVISQNPATKPVMIMQMTWSAGDHLVGRENIKTLNDLKGKKICLQQGGPHIALLDDALTAANLKWTDVTIVWAKDLTGTPESPAEMFRNDPSIDCCTVISPDMAGLTGGLDKKGNGAEGTSKGAHVVVSTSTMSRSIADTYLVRSDYFQSNRTDVEKFVAGYLKGCEELIANKKAYDDGKGQSPAYLATLKMAQQIYGEKVLPSIEVDAHGLICDAIFVGLAGNVSFFTDPGNLNGFDAKQKRALDVVTNLGFCKDRFGFQPAGWDYQQLATTAGIAYTAPKANQPKIKAEGIDAFPDSLDDRTILSFTISFQPNQKEFSLDTYSSDFRRVLQTASTFGNAAILIRGHADPTRTLLDFLQAGQKKGDIERRGVKGSFEYFFRGAPLDLNATAGIMKYIQDGEYNGVEPNPQLTMQVAQSLSLDRAEAVRKAIVEFAKINKINFDASQIKPDGVGIKEPLVAKPKNETDARRNMRVEFRMIKVAPESLNQSDFEF